MVDAEYLPCHGELQKRDRLIHRYFQSVRHYSLERSQHLRIQMRTRLNLRKKKGWKMEVKRPYRDRRFCSLQSYCLGRLIDCVLIDVVAEVLQPVQKQQKEKCVRKLTTVSWI